ncbi:hypothetical protein BGZ81_008134 [Podila clonocystis]|nr:hypothetical protein BGZ81_008134 [Podila clonocystis]
MATILSSSSLTDEQSTSPVVHTPILGESPTPNNDPSSSLTDEPSTPPVDNTSILEESPTTNNGQSPSPLLKKKKKDAFIVTVLKEDITKTAIVDDIHNEDEQLDAEQEEEEEEMDEEYIADKLYHLETGFKKSKSMTSPAQRGDTLALSTVQELKLIHKPLTENFHVLEVEPSPETLIKALYTLVELSAEETTELIQDWAIVYHVLLDLCNAILSHHASSTQYKSPSVGRMSFLKKDHFSQSTASTRPTSPSISPEILQSQKEVASSWAAQMRTFEQLARAFAHFANKFVQFSYLSETTAIANFYHDQIAPVFSRAQDEFMHAKALSQLNAHIDYTHLHKRLPKENALTTAEERKANVAAPLFTRQHIGTRRLLYDGELTEFVAPTYGNSKKKAAAIVVPKEYHLIVTTDFVYLCQVVQAGPPPSKKGFASQVKGFLSQAGRQKMLRLLHEPVAVNDCQISSTPDVTQIQRYMVMVCFYNQTSYILKAETGKERDAWVQVARELRIEQPKPSDACREQDDNETIERSISSTTINGENSKHKGPSLFKRLKSLRRSAGNLPEAGFHSPEIHPDQVTYTEEDEHARRMQLGQPSLWEVRRLPADLGVIPPLEHPIPFRRDNLYDTNVKIFDMTTGKVAPGEFGMGIEDRAAYHRDGCALFAVLRPPRLIKPEDVDKNREDFILVGKRTINGRDYCAEPPYITDFYARSWLHPNMRIEFDIEAGSVVIANMYRILCSSPKMVRQFETYYKYLMSEAKISPDNTFLSMDYRSYPLRISKKAQKTDPTSTGITSLTASKCPLHPSGSTLALGGHRRAFNDMGECNIEFRRMSNAEEAISVGFWNPATKRDMAVGVLMVRSSTVRTCSAMGLNTLLNYSVNRCVQRSSPTELMFTLLQTDVQTTPGFRKGQRVIRKTEGPTSLDEYKIEGTRESLNELEDFVRSRIGTDCKAREYRETLQMVKVAFHENVIDTCDVEEENEEKPQWTNGQVVEPSEDDLVYGQRVEGYLETLHEVPEEEEEKDLSAGPSGAVDEEVEQLEEEEEEEEKDLSTGPFFAVDDEEVEQPEDEQENGISAGPSGAMDDEEVGQLEEEQEEKEISARPSGAFDEEGEQLEEEKEEEEEKDLSAGAFGAVDDGEEQREEEDILAGSSGAVDAEEVEQPEEEEEEEEKDISVGLSDAVDSEDVEQPGEEEENDILAGPSDAVDDEEVKQLEGVEEDEVEEEEEEEEEESDLASSTATFRPKTMQALLAMEKQHQEAAAKESELDTAIQSLFLELDSTSFSDLASDGSLSAYLSSDEDQQQEEQQDMSAPSVADLAKFWAKTTSAVVRSPSVSPITSSKSWAKLTSSIAVVRSPSISSIVSSASQHFKVAEPSTDASVIVESSDLIASAALVSPTPAPIPTPDLTPAPAPAPAPALVTAPAGSELEARMSTVLAMVSTSSLAQAAETASAQNNASGVIQATRYLPKSRPVEDDRNEVETGVNVEQLRPVADLKKRWEEMHRLGI